MSTDMRTIELYKTTSAVTFTEEARTTWAAMTNHVAKLSGYYGAEHKYATEAAASFVRIASSLVGWGNVSVSRDGELSLICNERTASGQVGIVFGLIFHGTKRHCQTTGCGAILSDKGEIWTYSSQHSPILCEPADHDWLYPLDAPMPGTWSFHS